jgi:hypothetical protein
MNIPSELENGKIFFLISGIFNILIFMGWGANTIVGGIFTCGLGCLLGVFPVVNVVGAVMDFMAYNKLNNLNMPGTHGTIYNASIIQIITIVTGNIVSLIFGILNIQNFQKENVKTFLRDKDIY